MAPTVAGPIPRPRPVSLAYFAILTALGAGVVETLLRTARDGGAFTDRLPGLLLRVAIYLVVAAVAIRMAAGGRTARRALTLGLGVVGTASLTVEPLAVLLSAQRLRDPFLELSGYSAVLVGCRVVHILAVLVAVAAMYAPGARGHFRRR